MIVFDTETTNLIKPSASPLVEQPSMLEFAAVILDFKTLKEQASIEFFVNPGFEIPPEVTKMNGITNAMVKDAPPFAGRLAQLQEAFFGQQHMCAHNLDFDRMVLYYELLRLDAVTRFPWAPKHICTVEASYSINNYRLNLSKLHALVTGKAHDGAHRAMADVRALVTCIKWLRKEGWM